MYSGNDSSESQNYTQWALNPSSYQNMSNDQVDWAALAQQWIIMKEAGPPMPEPVKTAPPPPLISKHRKEHVSEGGEAPMDVENDDEGGWNEGRSGNSVSWSQPPGQPPPQQPPPWGWNNSGWSGPPAGVPPPTSIKPPLLPTPGFNSYGGSKDSNNEGANYNTPPPGPPGYWSSSSSNAKVIKPHNKRYSKVNVPVQVKSAVTLDAAKRKQLPAWIREGLEKMERDKLKQVDRGRDKSDTIDLEDKVKLRENALEILKSTVKPTENKKISEYDDDDDESDDSPASPPRRSPTPLTYEDMMLKVRRTMTEILLKVTNREIQNICREELQRHVRKLKASDQRVSAPSSANLSAKLGLGVYAGSEDSSAESDDDTGQVYHDSDSELRDVIRRRKEEFTKVERDIEDRLAVNVKRGENSRGATPDSDSQVDAKVQDRRLNRSEEGTPPPKILPHVNSKSSRKRYSSPSTVSDSDTDKNSSSKSKGRRSREKRSSSSSDRSKYSRSHTPRPRKHRKSASRSKRSRSRSRGRRDPGRSSKRKYSRSRSRSRSRSYRRRHNRSRSRRRSDSRSRSRSRSRSARRYRRSRSYSNGRGKRSHRH